MPMRVPMPAGGLRKLPAIQECRGRKRLSEDGDRNATRTCEPRRAPDYQKKKMRRELRDRQRFNKQKKGATMFLEARLSQWDSEWDSRGRVRLGREPAGEMGKGEKKMRRLKKSRGK